VHRLCDFSLGRLVVGFPRPYSRVMGERRRFPCAGTFVHVTTRATGRELLFHDDEDYARLGWLTARAAQRHGWRCLAHCFMPNHTHFVLWPSRETVSEGMRDLLSAYSRGFNARWERRGHLVERRYRLTPVADEQHLHRLLRYVALNPVAAKLVDLPEQWPHGSYAATVGEARAPGWLDVAAALRLFDREPGQARVAYRSLVEQRLP
jgi:putative transposase